MDEPRYLFRVDFRCGDNLLPGVFYASSEDTALSYCLHYTSIERFSREPEWTLLIYRVLMDDLRWREEQLVEMFDQNGYVVPIPEVDLDVLERTIHNLIDNYRDREQQA
jgi:hypothetical protein